MAQALAERGVSCRGSWYGRLRCSEISCMSDPDNALLSALHSGPQPPAGHLQPIHRFITNNTAFSLRPAVNALPPFVGFHHGFCCSDLEHGLWSVGELGEVNECFVMIPDEKMEHSTHPRPLSPVSVHRWITPLHNSLFTYQLSLPPHSFFYQSVLSLLSVPFLPLVPAPLAAVMSWDCLSPGRRVGCRGTAFLPSITPTFSL